MTTASFREKANFIWSVADLLRGDYKQAEYGKVILPLTVLRRLDCLLKKKKQKVLDEFPKVKGKSDHVIDMALNKAAGYNFHNRSKYDFEALAGDPNHVAANLRHYINGFSSGVREIIEHFNFDDQIERLDKADLLYQVVKRFSEIDLAATDGMEMGYVFEELIRKFAEISNETAGEHFTPREVIQLIVDLLFINDNEALRKKGVIRTLYDPTSGTGGMLSAGEAYIKQMNPDASLLVFGQEINPESYAICKADMLIKGQNPANIRGPKNTLSEDLFHGEQFNYMLSNPPYGVDWKKAEKVIRTEHEKLGYGGRFGAGLPRINDGSLLFLQHMIAKMKPAGEEGSRIGIVLNGSPLFTGSAGSGESDIRKWIIENDMLEAIVALPDQLFYNTGISTYIWMVTNHKEKRRKGKVQLINATGFFVKMAKSLGNKRNEISQVQINTIGKLYGDFREGEFVKIYPNNFFGYSRITVERPTRDAKGKIIPDKKGNPKPDADLRDYENIPLQDDIEAYFRREVLPHVPDAWIDHSKTKVGYEINFTKYFYQYKPLRSLEEIRADILRLEKTVMINQAVTKGLDPNVKMKDSGVEWLGEIPAHWEVKKLKYAIKSIEGGGTPSTDNPLFWNGTIPWVSPKDMKVEKEIALTEDYITTTAIANSSASLIPPGRVLIVVRSGILKHSLPIAINSVEVSLNQDMKAIESSEEIDTTYLFWLLKGQTKEILSFCNKLGATVDSIDIDSLMNYRIAFPELAEQREIVKRIESQTELNSSTISRIEKEIELLREYRTALISEVVTGKVCVL